MSALVLYDMTDFLLLLRWVEIFTSLTFNNTFGFGINSSVVTHCLPKKLWSIQDILPSVVGFFKLVIKGHNRIPNFGKFFQFKNQFLSGEVVPNLEIQK